MGKNIEKKEGLQSCEQIYKILGTFASGHMKQAGKVCRILRVVDAMI